MNVMAKDRWIEHKLTKDITPTVMYEYYACGRGEFPFDMLRYDAAWPADTGAAVQITAHVQLRFIRLRSYKPPTIERWSSFLWSVGKEPF